MTPTTTTFTFDGQPIAAVPGESIAAALTAAGHLTLRRDGQGIGRGMLCGMGACFECHVAVDGGPTTRACLTTVAPGMQVRSLTYREAVSEVASPPQAVHDAIDCDIAVVGAGPAGLSAAIELAEAGRRVVILDERPAPGGQYFKQKISAVDGHGDNDAQYRQGAELIARLRSSSTKYVSNATVWAAFPDGDGRFDVSATRTEPAAGLSKEQTVSLTVRAQTVIVAVGAYEAVPPFPGWTLPGVMATGAAQGLVRAYRVSPGDRVLIAGNGPLNLQLACELVTSGVDVVAVAESAPAVFPSRIGSALGALLASPALIAQGIRYRRILKNHGVPLMCGYHIREATGDAAINRATITKIDDDGRFRDTMSASFDIDALCLGYALQPSTELLGSLGCDHYSRGDGRYVPETDQAGRTSVSNVYAIGDGAGVGGAHVASIEGRLAASNILSRTPVQHDLRRLARHRRFQRHLWALYQAPDVAACNEDSIICRCESVTAGTLQSLVDSGIHDMNALKRLSRAGMGVCQGRYCRQTLLSMLRRSTGSEAAPFNPRVPAKPVPVAAIAREQPEWYGYREAAKDRIRPATVTSDARLADTDTLVVGAGIIGAAAAMYLARDGVDVTLIDRGYANGEASGGNAGSLHLQLLPFDFNEATSNLRSPAACTLALQKSGIEVWRELEAELQADFELAITGGLMLAHTETDLNFLRQKAALEKQFGIDVEILSAAETADRLPLVAERTVGAAYCPGEGKINPLLATLPLLAEARKHGAKLIEETLVVGIDRVRDVYRVATNRGEVRCRSIVIAAGGWSGQIADQLGVSLPIRPAPQQMLVTQATDMHVPYLLSLAGRHLTMKQVGNGNLLIGGGWPAETDPETGRSVILRKSVQGNLWAAMQVLPRLGALQVIRSWACTGVMIDGAPIVGALPGQPGVYIAVGANGYTMGPLLGRTLAELVTGDETSVDINAFSPDRFG